MNKRKKKQKTCTVILSHSSQNGYQENKQQMLVRIQGNRNTYTLLVGMQINAATTEISIEVPQ
jgi:hypothetical protein